MPATINTFFSSPTGPVGRRGWLGAVLVLALVSTIAIADQAHAAAARVADPLLAKALAYPAADLEKGFRYTRTATITALDEPAARVTFRHDGAKPEGQRETIIEAAEYKDGGWVAVPKDKAARRDDLVDAPDYADLAADLADATIMKTGETATTATYEVTPAKGKPFQFGSVHADIDVNDKAIQENIRGTLVVRKDGPQGPYVASARFRLKQEMGLVVAKIRRFDLGYAFAPVDGGRAIAPVATGLDLDMTALLFFKINVSALARTSDIESISPIN